MLSVSACGGGHSVLEPRGPVAAAIAETWWILFWGAAFVLSLVMGLLFYAMFRGPERRAPLPVTAFVLGGGLVFPTVVLTALLVYGTDVGRRITSLPDTVLLIDVTGHRWWWEFSYPATADAPAVLTANELYIPAGVPVTFALHSVDVIHSFWVPNLGHKIDLIPGRSNTLRLLADEPGVFGGQCAEFCGAQHARMKFTVIALTPDEFSAWRERRAGPAAVSDAAGHAAFVDSGCDACHRIGGTGAQGVGGPDLTHIGSRARLGAGTIANDAEGLRRWLEAHGADIKPANLGPIDVHLGPELIETLAQYLERLE